MVRPHSHRCLSVPRVRGFAVTIHAGEAEGPQAAQNIRDSIEMLHADRIGHGVRIMEDPEVLEFVRERGTVLELCPTSNWLSGVCPHSGIPPLPQDYGGGHSDHRQHR